MKFISYIIVLQFLTVEVFSQVISKCRATTEKYSNCVSSFHADTFDSKCGTYASPQCKELFKTPEKILKDCDKEFIEITSAVLKDMHNILKYTCKRDEQGDYCPLSKIIQETELHPDIYQNMKFSEIFESIKGSCSSQKCLKVAITYMESLKDMLTDDQNKEKEEVKGLLNFLNNCPKNHAVNVNFGNINVNNNGANNNYNFNPIKLNEILDKNNNSESMKLITALDHSDTLGSISNNNNNIGNNNIRNNINIGNNNNIGNNDVIIDTNTNTFTDIPNQYGNNGSNFNDNDLKNSLDNNLNNTDVSNDNSNNNNNNNVPDASASQSNIVLTQSFLIISFMLSLLFMEKIF